MRILHLSDLHYGDSHYFNQDPHLVVCPAGRLHLHDAILNAIAAAGLIRRLPSTPLRRPRI